MIRVSAGAFLALGVLGLAITLLVTNLATAQQFSPWSPPTNLNVITLSDGTRCPSLVNTASNDEHPTISKDGLSLIITSDRPGGFGRVDLWVTHRDSLDGCWKTPVNLGSVVNSPPNTGAPNLTTDGHWLYFHSRRLGGCNGGLVAELWVTHRHDARDDFGWEKPINLGCAINMSGFLQNGPNHFENETTGTQFLYFTRLPVGKTEDFYAIYVSTCNADLATCNTKGLWGPGEKVDALNVTPDPQHGFGRSTRTAIRRRDGLEMIISSKRAGGLGGSDLWMSTRATTLDQNWSIPKNLTVVNSSANDGGPALSWDGTELYFYSNRTDLPGAAGGNDLYVSRRSKLPD